MIILITGGAWQGKSAFAKTLAEEQNGKLHGEPEGISDEEFVVIEDVHFLVKDALEMGHDPQEDIAARIRPYPNVILTVNELGCGVVPMEAFDRNWRETTGRVCCELARQADAVYRVTCGIATRIK